MKYLISFIAASVILCCCVPKTTTEGGQSDTVMKAGKTAPTLSSLDTKVTTLTAVNTSQDTKIATLTTSVTTLTSKITTLTNSDATLTSAINTLSVANTAKDKTIAAQAVTIKNITDSLNAYKGTLDLVLFKKTGGVITIPVIYQIAQALNIQIK